MATTDNNAHELQVKKTRGRKKKVITDETEKPKRLRRKRATVRELFTADELPPSLVSDMSCGTSKTNFDMSDVAQEVPEKDDKELTDKELVDGINSMCSSGQRAILRLLLKSQSAINDDSNDTILVDIENLSDEQKAPLRSYYKFYQQTSAMSRQRKEEELRISQSLQDNAS